MAHLSHVDLKSENPNMLLCLGYRGFAFLLRSWQARHHNFTLTGSMFLASYEHHDKDVSRARHILLGHRRAELLDDQLPQIPLGVLVIVMVQK